MPSSVEKVYSEALFILISEENEATPQVFSDILPELDLIDKISKNIPDFSKMMISATVSLDEKQKLLYEVFYGKFSRYVFNFLFVLVNNNRFGYFSRIFREFKKIYNNEFGIADIIVTTAQPLDDETREKITEKMSEITGKAVNISEKIDRNLIGGIIIDYETKRYDGSVKTRLEALKLDIAAAII